MQGSIHTLRNLTTAKRNLRHLTALWGWTPMGQLPWLTKCPSPVAWELAGVTIAVQKSGAVAAVVVEGSSSIHMLVHVSWCQVPGSCNVFGRHRMRMTHTVTYGSFR